MENVKKIVTIHEKKEQYFFNEKRRKFLNLISTGIVVVLGGSFHFGYQISLINPLADVLQNFLERCLKE